VFGIRRFLWCFIISLLISFDCKNFELIFSTKILKLLAATNETMLLVENKISISINSTQSVKKLIYILE